MFLFSRFCRGQFTSAQYCCCRLCLPFSVILQFYLEFRLNVVSLLLHRIGVFILRSLFCILIESFDFEFRGIHKHTHTYILNTQADKYYHFISYVDRFSVSFFSSCGIMKQMIIESLTYFSLNRFISSRKQAREKTHNWEKR